VPGANRAGVAQVDGWSARLGRPRAITSAASRADGAGDRGDGALEDRPRVVSERHQDDRVGARIGERAKVVRGMDTHPNACGPR